MRKELWEARRTRIEELAAQGMTPKKIAEVVGITPTTTYKYLKLFSIKIDANVTEDNPQELVTAIIRALENGGTMMSVHAETGYTYYKVRSVALSMGVKLKHGLIREFDPRSEVMFSMYSAGKTLAEIGDAYGVSSERVRQILKKYHDHDRSFGGASFSAGQKKKTKVLTRSEKCIKRHGCTLEDYNNLLSIGKKMMADGQPRRRTPCGAFTQQKNSANQRGITWNLKLWDWWQIWEKSGKFYQRGRHSDEYVMCRFKDKGGYEVGNVYIATVTHNLTVQPNNPWRNESHPDYSKVREERRARKEASLFHEVAA